MNNVRPIRPVPTFDQHADTVINMMAIPAITPPDGIAFKSILAGPASDPELDSYPVVSKKRDLVFGVCVIATTAMEILQTVFILKEWS